MYLENKIYAEEDPSWIGNKYRILKIIHPRWWNPLFWLAVLFDPIIEGFIATYKKCDETSYISSFYYGVSESSRDICNFFHRFRI